MADQHEKVAIVSKMLVLDEDSVHQDSLKTFCEQSGLIGIRPNKQGAASVMSILKSNVDLGGILIGERYMGTPDKTFELVAEIRTQRPELPIFLRRTHLESLAGLPVKTANMFKQAYTLNDLRNLSNALESSIFSRLYPNELARGIRELSINALQNLFPKCDIEAEAPYLVTDRIIHGEVFTLIAIESDWCRGYMTFQGPEQPLLDLLSASFPGTSPTFRDLNQHLGELTNLVWGGFKNKYVGSQDGKNNTQVPIIINHHRRFISFGSEDPQLCFKYVLTPRSGVDVPNSSADPRDYDMSAASAIYQRFVFNLSWSPEDFKENASVESLVQSGELELF
jgi:hypothetical protein